MPNAWPAGLGRDSHTEVGEKVAGPRNAPVIGECVPLRDEPLPHRSDHEIGEMHRDPRWPARCVAATGGYPIVLVNLDSIDRDELRELITDSWLIKAPPKLRRQLETQ